MAVETAFYPFENYCTTRLNMTGMELLESAGIDDNKLRTLQNGTLLELASQTRRLIENNCRCLTESGKETF
jgi:hypothetical protein